MSGFGTFLGKEVTEIRKTWRIWVIPGMLIFFAITSPIIAAVTPALLGSISKSQPGVVMKIPSPTWRDAYAQYLKSLGQMVLIAVVITGAGAVSGERSSGTAILALTKPVSRAAFVMAKIVSQAGLLIAATVLSTVVCVALTIAIFGSAPLEPLLAAVSIWTVDALLLIVVMTLFSAAFASRGAAAGAGLGFFFLTLLISIWDPANRYSFVGLMSASGRALVSQPTAALWPVVTSLIAGVVCARGAVRVFERQEL
jgi:ABC-2 type transport system permease protein